MLGKIFQWLKLPGLIKPFSIYDKDVQQRITVRTSSRYTIIQVGSKEYFFIRETGKYDGWGGLQL